jgi:zinc protease
MTRTLTEIRSSDLGPRPIPAVDGLAAAVSPPYIDTMLSTGLRVLLVRHPSAPTVQLTLGIPFADQDPRHAARSAMLVNTVLTGTSRRDRLAIESEFARIGGIVTAASTPERLAIGGAALSSGLATLLDVVADCVTSAAYRESEVAVERDRLAQTLMLKGVDPDILAGEALQQRCYGDHPIARMIADPSHVATVTSEELRVLHTAVVVPKGSTLVLVGDLDLDDTLREVERAFARWTSEASAPLLPSVPEVVGGDLLLRDLPGAVQSHIRLCAQAVPRDDPRFPALSLATLALGGGITGRLAEVVRQRMGLCYRIVSELQFNYSENGEQGTITVALNTATATGAQALRTVRAELARFCNEPPDEVELDRIRRYAMGGQLIATMSQLGLAKVLVSVVTSGLSVPRLVIERELMATVTVKDVAAVAEEFFDPARFAGVILGNAEELGASFTDEDGVRLP